MKVKYCVNYVHGVCEWMEGHTEHTLYIVTCNCTTYCETFVVVVVILVAAAAAAAVAAAVASVAADEYVYA